jgi:hypothetical protein
VKVKALNKFRGGGCGESVPQQRNRKAVGTLTLSPALPLKRHFCGAAWKDTLNKYNWMRGAFGARQSITVTTLTCKREPIQ